MTFNKANINHPNLVLLFDYWDSIRGDRTMPARREIDPLDIPSLLGNIILFDVEYDPMRFKVRLYGTVVAAARGRDLTGHYMDEPGVSRIIDVTKPANEQVVTTKAPHYINAPYPVESGSAGHFFRLSLPLSDDGEHVNMVMTGFYKEQRVHSGSDEEKIFG